MKMTTLKQYVVDAFTDEVFKGNPAAVCVLEKPLSDALMQSIAKENNLSETAFVVPANGGRWNLRWFTPGGEIDLCGHATLGSAYVLTRFVTPEANTVYFDTQSGLLNVIKKDDLYEMNMPAYDLKPVEVTDAMEKAIGFRPVEAYMARDLVCVLEDGEQVKAASPNGGLALNLDGLLLHLTGKGSGEYDCVTRSFAPKLNVVEDPVAAPGIAM